MVMCRALGEENVFWRRNQRLKDNGQTRVVEHLMSIWPTMIRSARIPFADRTEPNGGASPRDCA
jgi:hypothetical protein